MIQDLAIFWPALAAGLLVFRGSVRHVLKEI